MTSALQFDAFAHHADTQVESKTWSSADVESKKPSNTPALLALYEHCMSIESRFQCALKLSGRASGISIDGKCVTTNDYKNVAFILPVRVAGMRNQLTSILNFVEPLYTRCRTCSIFTSCPCGKSKNFQFSGYGCSLAYKHDQSIDNKATCQWIEESWILSTLTPDETPCFRFCLNDLLQSHWIKRGFALIACRCCEKQELRENLNNPQSREYLADVTYGLYCLIFDWCTELWVFPDFLRPIGVQYSTVPGPGEGESFRKIL